MWSRWCQAVGAVWVAVLGLAGNVSGQVFSREVVELLPHAVVLWEAAVLKWPSLQMMQFLDIVDMDGDGLLDLVVSVSNQLGIFKQEGTGRFSLRPCDFYEARSEYIGLGSYLIEPLARMAALTAALVDLDGDGVLDVAVSTAGQPTPDKPDGHWLYTFRNREGCFKRGQALELPFPLHFLAGHPGKDRVAGLLGVNVGDEESKVVFLPRRGLLSFGSPFVAATGRGWPVHWGDVTGDGRPDLLFHHRKGLTLLPGSEDRVLGTAQDFSLNGRVVKGVAPGDFTGDGIPELVLLTAERELIVVQWDGNAFRERVRQPIATWYDPEGIVLGDFTGDGLVDAGVWGGSGRLLTILAGIGQGLFHATGSEFFWVDIPSVWRRVADLNGDGRAELVLASPYTIHVLRNGGEPRGTNQLPAADILAAGDLTGDGAAELLVRAGKGIDVLWNNGRGGFIRSALTRFPTPGPNARVVEIQGRRVEVVVEDDKEFWLRDLTPVAAHIMEGMVVVLLERIELSSRMEERLAYELRLVGLDGTELKSLRVGVGKVSPILAGGDLDADGKMDIVMLRDRELLVHWGGTPGLSTYSLPGEPYLLAVGEVTGNGLDDAVVALVDQDARLIVVTFAGRSPALSEAHLIFDLFAVPLAMATADLDGDGVADVAVIAARLVVDQAAGTVTVEGAEIWMHCSQAGALVHPLRDWPKGDAPWPLTGFVAGDMTGDGHVDLAFTTVAGAGIFLLPGQGGCCFSSLLRFPVPSGPLFCADLDGNGQQELIAARLGGNPVVWILWNGGGQ
ncbi:MAG: VCBS repeat-containing protein [Candidatus Bipolaricaulaceae bacterium]